MSTSHIYTRVDKCINKKVTSLGTFENLESDYTNPSVFQQKLNSRQNGCRNPILHCRWECKNLVLLLWKSECRFLKTQKIELSYDRARLNLDTYPKVSKVNFKKDTCPAMFSIALFPTAKSQNQPGYPAAGEGIKTM